MKQEDSKKYCIKHHHQNGSLCSYCEAIKLRDKEWVEEIETLILEGRIYNDWQALKSKMGVEDELA